MKRLTRRETLGLLSAGAAFGAAPAFGLSGPPFLAEAIMAGDMPEVSARLPKVPRVINTAELGGAPGRYGGEVRMLVGSQKDVRVMPILGYSRLVGYDRDFSFVPDILQEYDVQDGRVFTFVLREGHRWSDGAPFTTEDLRYAFEDVMMHDELPGVSLEMKPDDEIPTVEVIDEVTIRYSWTVANPEFLPSLAAPVPPRIVMPSAYMKQFHQDYQDQAQLDAFVAEQRVDHWRALHTKMSRQNRPENPDLPTLEPWRPRTAPPAQQYVFERNPYFHRVDERGQQLPYVDRYLLNVSSYEVIPAKVAAGDADLQYRTISFGHYTVLKEAEKRHPVKVSLWRQSVGSRLALYPNLTCADPVWRAMFQDVRVRRALSLAIDRDELNQALFFGLCQKSANTILPESPLYKPEYAKAYADFDPDEANRLLDEAGFTKAGVDGLRSLPDGRVAGILIETAGESSLETDALELVGDHFRRVGIELWTRSSQRDIFRSRVLAGQVVMSIWAGLDNGVPSADMSPRELAPTTDDQLQWPAWGVNYLSSGAQGEAPTLPEVQRLVELMKAWKVSESTDQREALWTEMLQIHADQVYSIGTVNQAPQPILHAADLKNIPESGLFGYHPTSNLGIYNPDQFWLDREDTSNG